MLVARTEGLLIDPKAVAPAIDKLVAFAAAGADCLYAARRTRQGRYSGDGPRGGAQAAQCPDDGTGTKRCRASADLRVRRISVGGALARVAWDAVAKAAERIREGSFDGLPSGKPAVKPQRYFRLCPDAKAPIRSSLPASRASRPPDTTAARRCSPTLDTVRHRRQYVARKGPSSGASSMG